ncbi:MAG: methyltransferase domain-containing protein [Acidobacteria bacterium]|nr:methyltransferase domain-containing protein [Acidobacteriota bacterium]
MSLSASDAARLEVLLRNEADMAFRRRAFRLLDWLELNDGEEVLDCGCGMGFYLMTMAALRALRLTGIDGDEGRLRWARRECVPAHLLRTDVEHLPFADGRFDKILLSEVLEHLSDDAAGLRELWRVLRPGGILAISVPHARYPFWWDPINRVWIALGGQPIRSGPVAGIWSNHQRLYEPETLLARVQQAGFRVERMEEATHYSFPLAHFLVYGIGKPLLEHNLLPRWARNSADRFSGARNRGNPWNPVNAFVRVLRLFDRLNDSPRVGRKRTFVNVLVKARKP